MSPAGRVVSRSLLEWAGSGFDPRELEIYSFCLPLDGGVKRVYPPGTPGGFRGGHSGTGIRVSQE